MTFAAGDTLTAASLEILNSQIGRITAPLWELGSTTGSSAIGASGVEATQAAFTAPSSTYRATTAYQITIHGICRATNAGNLSIQVRDTNAAGTVRMGSYETIALLAATNSAVKHYEGTVANTGGSDITGRVLCVTFNYSAAAGALFNASTTSPWYIRCIELGPSGGFPLAVPL